MILGEQSKIPLTLKIFQAWNLTNWELRKPMLNSEPLSGETLTAKESSDLEFAGKLQVSG